MVQIMPCACIASTQAEASSDDGFMTAALWVKITVYFCLVV